MEPILIAVIPVVIIGVLCAAVLVIASKLMAVKEDERFPAVRGCLPGANCGACGFAGCDGYAKALCASSKTPANLCIPGGAEVAQMLSEQLGVAFEDVQKQFAFVHCGGTCQKTETRADYQGMQSCRGAKLLYGGSGSCLYGCIGLGDCADVCPENAICVDNGVAWVNPERCIGCGLCTRTCPNGLISLVSSDAPVQVACHNTDKGALTRKACSAGCIGCKKCERTCPNGAVTVQNNVAVIDTAKCAGCPDPGKCAAVCPVGCLTSLT